MQIRTMLMGLGLVVPLAAGCSTTVTGEAVPAVVTTSAPVAANDSVDPPSSTPTAPVDSPYVYGGVTPPTPVPGLMTGAGPTGTWTALLGGLAPGVSIGQATPSGRAFSRCTVGLLAKRGAERFAITAGHCAEPASTHVATVSYADAAVPRKAVPAGVYTETAAAGADVAVIRLAASAEVASGQVGGTYRIAESADAGKLRPGMQLCKVGSTTALTCGPIASVGTRTLTARVVGEPGDSGSLGFVKRADGTVGAVGIMSTSTGVFYLLRPALHDLGLTVIS